MSEYLAMLERYMNTLINKFPSSKEINQLEYKQKISIVKDLEGLVTKSYSEDKNNAVFQDLLTKKVIPYVTMIVKNDNNVVSVSKILEILKNLYKIAGSISLKHFIIYYEWDWDDKFLEPRLDILSGYCNYLQKLVLDENFTTVIAMLPSGYRKKSPLKIRRSVVLWYRQYRKYTCYMFK